MLKVENLTKIYSRGENTVVALNEVNFTLDNKGFVFITGKSGCGKSTLLNMIGGLDNLTSGDIVCDGNRLSQFKNSDFDNYRNTYLGFVFQDYCLIDDLDVYQNIEIAIDLKGESLSKSDKDKKIEDALKSVDLDIRIKHRYVKELSGGQKQRVAIARALIKDPKMILADEPTGNLDSKTSEKILKTLKKLSQDRLVVIVSHSKEDAKKYADRIIELADGVVKSDSSRCEEGVEDLTYRRGVLTLPHSTTLSSRQLKEINNNLKENKIRKIKQNSSGFKKTKEDFEESSKVNIEPKKMSKRSTLRFAKHFIKKRWFASSITVFVVTLLIFVLGLSQFFIQFNEADTVYSVMKDNGESDLLIQKGFYNEDNLIDDSKCIRITDNDIQELVDSGYEGDIYKVYNNAIAFNSTHFQLELVPASRYLFKDLYVRESCGTLACDEDFLNRRFGNGGEVEVLAGVIRDPFLEKTSSGVSKLQPTKHLESPYREHGLIITDYLADCWLNILQSGYSDYSDIVGKVYRGTYINGIINTGYKEKYADLIQYAHDIKIGIDRSSEEDYYKERITAFVSDVQKKYGLAYSTEPDFEKYVSYSNNASEATMSFAKIQYSDGRVVDQTNHMWAIKTSSSFFGLTGNEVVTRFDMFNESFGGALGLYYTEDNLDTFQPVTITIHKTDGTEEENVLYSIELTIKALFGREVFNGETGTTCYLWTASDDVMKTVMDYSLHSYAMYLEDASQLGKIYDIIESNPYVIQSNVYKSISQVGYIVQIFDDLFWLILVAIGGISIILLVSYAYGNIKKRYYEIGVLKGLGATTKNVGFIFSMQTILAGVIISVLSTILLLTLSSPINSAISNELLKFINNSKISEIAIIATNVPTILINIGVVLLVTIVSCLLPIIKLNKIKPKTIIASDE